MIDSHIHTRFSFDSDEEPENYVLAAKARGDKILGFAEHYNYDYIPDDSYAELPDIEAYGEAVRALNARYSDFKVLMGIELGYAADSVPHYRELLAENNFDYAVLSVHTVAGRGDCFFPKFFAGITREQAYGAYLNAVLESVRSDVDFQIVGHIGYIARYAPFEQKRITYREFGKVIDEILRGIIGRGVCLELNTSTGGLSSFFPETEIADRYLELGGKNFTFGSDAHTAARYADNADGVKAYLKSRGIDAICRFEKRRLIREKI